MNNLQSENQKTILIIDDDMPLQKAYQAALTHAGYNAIFASTGPEGLQKIKTDNPQLIILDLMLPGGMNGFDILEQIEGDKQLLKIPLFILTNLDSEENTAFKMGVKKYFVKANISINEVINEINLALN